MLMKREILEFCEEVRFKPFKIEGLLEEIEG
jgi:hypothetical protein